jgi:hypothetical protein
MPIFITRIIHFILLQSPNKVALTSGWGKNVRILTKLAPSKFTQNLKVHKFFFFLEKS